MATEATFGYYRLLALIGRGGMGEVWRAHDTRKDREVALKILGSWLGTEADYARRFRREAALAARLNAPNIIPIHDYGEIDGRLFIDMPLVGGSDLEALLDREGPLDPRRVVSIIDQLADALDVAHEAELVHRDVKPSNVLVTTRRDRDFVYLVDFGVARPVRGTSISQTGAMIGTPAYMAPERFEGTGDRRGDVYALACVLHTALTGRSPFQAPDGAFHLGFYLDAHRFQDPPSASSLISDVPPAFDTVIARGMAKQAADRYPTAGELATAARAALVSPPVPRGIAEARPSTTATGLVTARTPLAGTSADPHATGPDGSSSTAIDAHDFQVDRTSIPAPPVATARHDAGPGLKVRATAASTSVQPPTAVRPRRTWSLRRKILLGVGLYAALAVAIAPIVNVVVNPGVDEGPLVGHGNAVTAVATAELDGRPVIVSGSVDESVRVWDLATHAQVGKPLIGHTGSVLTVATGEVDGRRVIISGGSDDTIRVWDLATHEQIGTPLTGHTSSVLSVAITHLHGRTVVVSISNDQTIRVWDLASRALIGKPFPSFSGLAHGKTLVTVQPGLEPEIVVGTSDGRLRVWDLDTQTPLADSIAAHNDAINALAVAQLNGRTVVVTGSSDRSVRVWDLRTHALVGDPISGLTGAVYAVAVTLLHGRPVIIAGSSDQTVHVWDLATHASLGKPFPGHGDAVDAVAVTALTDGRLVAVSGSYDTAVRVWDLAARARS